MQYQFLFNKQQTSCCRFS